MIYLFLLSKENLELAIEEVLTLTKSKKYEIKDKLLIIELDELDKKIINRLALTKSVHQLLFKTTNSNLKNKIKNFNWNSIYKTNFAVKKETIKGSLKLKEKTLANIIWKKLEKPKVNLEKPKTEINFFTYNKSIYCTNLLKNIKDKYDKRKAHKRPFHHPSSLHPRLAKALINLTGAMEKDIILDPFCGSGGILIEAGLLKIKSIGYDIDKVMLKGCRENLNHFKITNVKLKKKNALKIKKTDYIVTDLPYGLNSTLFIRLKSRTLKKISLKTENKIRDLNKKYLEKFYLKFLKKLKKKLKKRAVIILPNFVKYKTLLKKSKLKINKEFTIYVHKNLSRKIILINNG